MSDHYALQFLLNIRGTAGGGQMAPVADAAAGVQPADRVQRRAYARGRKRKCGSFVEATHGGEGGGGGGLPVPHGGHAADRQTAPLERPPPETRPPPPLGEGFVCATEVPAEGARDPDGPLRPRPVGSKRTSAVRCRAWTTSSRDGPPAGLREEKVALQGPWSGLYARMRVENRVLTEAGQPGCICVPAQVRPRLVHDHPLGGHDGERRTRETLRRQYLWPKLAQGVAAWVQCCRACQQCGQKSVRYQVPPSPIRVSRADQLVGIDLQGPFPQTHRGDRYILVAVEYFTRYPVASPDKTALVVTRAFVEHYVLKHGIPERVITDQGSAFETELLQALCREFGIQKDHTTAYHPQANGGAYKQDLSREAQTYGGRQSTGL
uniref:Uncharacterized protein LOC116958080 n=1 Tax=Petromyzon marinus TaxID=7757 RepID=A0AAJ7UKN0_PETMA|nr:uncharacterized protein LOC116958080 [Petromyzon marinus]